MFRGATATKWRWRWPREGRRERERENSRRSGRDVPLIFRTEFALATLQVTEKADRQKSEFVTEKGTPFLERTNRRQDWSAEIDGFGAKYFRSVDNVAD
jgi:hypothetical protein